MTQVEPRLGIDVGGSQIKCALVDTSTGRLTQERHAIATPAGFGVVEVTDAILGLADEFAPNAPVGVGMPAVVHGGRILSPPTADEVDGWVGRNLSDALSQKHGALVRIRNDADVAGLAEMAFGAGRDQMGVVLLLTLGTGVGSALFHDGVLVPNTELGKLYLASSERVSEHFVASRIKTELGLSWDEWAGRLALYLEQVDRLLRPDLVILGGGISQQADRFLPQLLAGCEVRAAELGNDAGIIGAARLAADEE